MSNYLLLGPVLFQDFELPERIRWGGAQGLAIHRLPGGVRVIDSLGRDDGDIAWHGVFTGSDAGTRARLIDLLRAEGSVLPLAWASFFYSVVIHRFEADYTASNWIPYSLTCTVLRDEAETLIQSGLSLGESILSDLANAAELGSATDLSGVGASLDLPGAFTPGTADFAQATGALHSALDTVGKEIKAGERTLGSLSLSSAGGILNAVTTAERLAADVRSSSFLARASRSLAVAAI